MEFGHGLREAPELGLAEFSAKIVLDVVLQVEVVAIGLVVFQDLQELVVFSFEHSL